MKTNTICLAALLAFTTAPALAQTADGQPTASATKGAVAGGVAGHMMGHHTKTGVVAGAMVGHHMKKKQMDRAGGAG